MNIIRFFFPILMLSSFAACGQIGNHQHQPIRRMEYQKIESPLIQGAIQAWQKADSTTWLSFFTPNPNLLDDGKTRDFHQFSTETIGKERFISIDKVENNGLNIYGRLHSDTWGDFKTYFKFHVNATGKIDRLEIGQATY